MFNIKMDKIQEIDNKIEDNNKKILTLIDKVEKNNDELLRLISNM